MDTAITGSSSKSVVFVQSANAHIPPAIIDRELEAPLSTVEQVDTHTHNAIAAAGRSVVAKCPYPKRMGVKHQRYMDISPHGAFIS